MKIKISYARLINIFQKSLRASGQPFNSLFNLLFIRIRKIQSQRVNYATILNIKWIARDECNILFNCKLKLVLSLIHISEPTRLGMISYAVCCLKKKKRPLPGIERNKTQSHSRALRHPNQLTI